MSKTDSEVVKKVVEKVLADFDFEVEDMLESEEVEKAVQDEIMENIDEESPSIDWIELVELDDAEAYKNKNGDFLSN